MGLDIYVQRIAKKPTADADHFTMVDDNLEYTDRGFPAWTKKFETKRKHTYYDWNKYKEESGIDLEHCKWESSAYTEKGNFMYVYPEDKELPEYEEGKDYDEIEKLRNEIIIKIDLDKVPTFDKEVVVIYYDDSIGYQRKGLNGKFYEDMRAGTFAPDGIVWTRAELEHVLNEYCDEPYEYVYPNGKKSGDIINPKENFKRNILDVFVEGKDCVLFSW